MRSAVHLSLPLLMSLLPSYSICSPGVSPTVTSLNLGPTIYTAGPLQSVWKNGYYNEPTGTSEEPQPRVSDPVTGKTYPFNLTSSKYYPHNNTVDPVVLPPVPSDKKLHNIFVSKLSSIIDAPSSTYGGSCGKCIAGLQVGQSIALTRPDLVVDIMIELCKKYHFSNTCDHSYGGVTYGGPITQVLANANISGDDGQMICSTFLSGSCPVPSVPPLDLDEWFKKPKPENSTAPVPPVGGQRLKVLHISDFHLDPRYEIGSESNCSGAGSLCCRHGVFSPSSPGQVLSPAPRYGAFQCDTPFDLALALLESIPILTATEDIKHGFDFSLYTGDLVSHDLPLQISRSYVEYTETVIFELLQQRLNSGPIYVALGNHDSLPDSGASPKNYLNTQSSVLVDQFNWNYDHLARLWEYEGWIDRKAAKMARTHYSGYSVRQRVGLRIITINTDFCKYKANYFNYMNISSSDPGGVLRFLTDELQAAEEVGERVWIVGHVLSGWDGSNPLPAPTNLFYQIVDRYSPHVIAGIFFGHTHEDQFMLYYANNATSISSEAALAVGWMGPSITPGNNLNSGFRVYEVDATTFDILDAHTWYANVSTFADLESQVARGPAFSYEYSSREEYGKNISWPASAPLNATWWHKVTEQMEIDSSLVQTFTTNQGKHSVKTKPCDTKECATAKICYMRSGSTPIAKQNCQPGYGSVQ